MPAQSAQGNSPAYVAVWMQFSVLGAVAASAEAFFVVGQTGMGRGQTGQQKQQGTFVHGCSPWGMRREPGAAGKRSFFPNRADCSGRVLPFA